MQPCMGDTQAGLHGCLNLVSVPILNKSARNQEPERTPSLGSNLCVCFSLGPANPALCSRLKGPLSGLRTQRHCIDATSLHPLEDDAPQ